MSDKNASASEKIRQGISAITMGLPSLISGIKGLAVVTNLAT